MILYNSEKNIRDVRLFVVHFLNCFVTAVLQSIFILQQRFISLTAAKLLWDLTAKYCWNRPPPKLPGWIRPWYDATTTNHLLVQSECDQHCCPCDHTQTITWSRDLVYWFFFYIKKTETKWKTGVTLLQVKTILTTLAKSTKTILYDKKIV